MKLGEILKHSHWAIFVAVVMVSVGGCAPRYAGPHWTFYIEEPLEAKPANFEPQIFFSDDLMLKAKTSDFMDELPVPPHISIASAAGRGLTLGEVMEKSRELGADGVIVTRIGKAGIFLGVDSIDMGKEVAGATFIKFKEAERKRESKGLFER